jgi:Protein of unknown function (DUF3558)
MTDDVHSAFMHIGTRRGDASMARRDHHGGWKRTEKFVAVAHAILRRTVMTISLGALVAGCSTGPSTSSAAPKTATAAARSAPAASSGTIAASTRGAQGKLDPCSMLTTDQVTAALGQPPATGKPEPDFDAPEYEWDPASGDNGNVTLDVGPWDGDPGVKPIRLGTGVPNLGDEAYDGGNTGLYVHKGAQGFRIWVFNVHTQSSRLDLEKQLAGILLAQM